MYRPQVRDIRPLERLNTLMDQLREQGGDPMRVARQAAHNGTRFDRALERELERRR